PAATGGGSLALSEAIDLVVDYEISKVHIPASSMSEMVSANAITVSVSTRHNDREFVVGHLRPSGHRQGAPVQSMHPVGIEVSGKVGRAADSTDRQYFVRPAP